jgi:formyl-CoA transferase
MDTTENFPPGALAGIRVIDFTQVMAGPFCTMLLADLGADVIKIENPKGGDQTRRAMGTPGKGEDTMAFIALNRNKRSVCLDLKDPAQVEDLKMLIRDADVVIENWRPGVADRLGLGFKELSELNPRLVYASISGFGQTGPYSQRPGYDLIAQAMTGVMSVMGMEGAPPVKSAIPVADLGAGLFCLTGILSALYSREQTGQGQYVETSLYHAALAMAVWETTEYFSTGEPPKPLGSGNRVAAPYQALATSDGHIVIAANNQRFWNDLCACLDSPELLDDPRYRTNADRMRHRDELAEDLEKYLTGQSTQHWTDVLLSAGIAAGPILDYGQVLDSDAHVTELDLVKTLPHPVEGDVRIIANPITLSRTPSAYKRNAPLLGEHTSEVLEEKRLTASARQD